MFSEHKKDVQWQMLFMCGQASLNLTEDGINAWYLSFPNISILVPTASLSIVLS